MAILKYIKCKPTETTNINQTTTETGEVFKSKLLSDWKDSTPCASSTTSNIEHEPHEKENIADVDRVDLKDVGLWPSKVNNDTWLLLVHQGAAMIQNLDSNFYEVICQGVSTKWQTKNLTQESFF